MRKILYITFARFPSETAHSVNIIKMCQSIKRLGNELTLVADFRKRSGEVFEMYDIRHPFDIKSLKLNNIRFLGRVIFLVRVFFYARRRELDLAYTRDVFNAFLAKTLRIPFIFEVHEIPCTRMRKLLLVRTLKSPHLKCLIFISHSLKNLMESSWQPLIKNRQNIVAHDGADLDSFETAISKQEARTLADLPQETLIAGYTGSLFPGRGTELILKLAVQLKDMLFVLIGGEGKYLESLREKLEKLNIQNVLVLGHKAHKQMPVYLMAFDILLMPYQKEVLHRQRKHDTSAYMSPLKMFEYMASGKPIVASHIAVVTEVLQNDYNALLVPPDDLYAWKEALEILKDDREIALRIGLQAKKDAKRYSWDERANKILKSIS